MNDLIIQIEKNTRKVILEQVYLGNDHENLQEKLIFQFDTFVNGQARLEYELNDELNYLILTKEEETYTIPVQNVLTIYQDDEEKAGKIQFQLVITEGTQEENVPVFKSNIFYLRVRPSLNAVTEAPEGYDLWIEQANAKLNLIDEKLEDMAEALEDVNEAITEVNNLDLDVNKVDKTATVTLNKKDGTVKTVQIDDGISLQFMWQGTSLGIKTENQESYTFVDLQGIQGPIGPQGEAFQIKKTYSSVAEMNADFDNMQLGDYVMIASTTEVEDNAKLYTRGESQWIFISDFSGAQGIKGETGATPNIQIGTVTSGNTPSVTRSGTDENPVLNFVLVKGDKGDTGDTGATGATGNGIASITKTGTVGLVDTYTITFTDGTTTTFEITNGEDGEVTQEQLDAVIAENESLKAQLPTGTGTGEHITLTDSAGDINWKSIKPNGKTEQNSTTGKQLINLPDGTYGEKGITAVVKDGEITLNGTATDTAFTSIPFSFQFKASTNYIISSNNPVANNDVIIRFDNNVKPYGLSTINKTSSFSFEEITTVSMFKVRVSSGVTLTNFKIKPMLEEGSTASAWEKYTGRNTCSQSNLSTRDKECRGGKELCQYKQYS